MGKMIEEVLLLRGISPDSVKQSPDSPGSPCSRIRYASLGEILLIYITASSGKSH